MSTISHGLHVTLFNRYKEMVDKSRIAICRHIMYLLKPTDGYPKGSDAHLSELLQIWDADKRAMDAALKEHWHSGRAALPVMPPDDVEHSLCRKMAAIQIEALMYGEHSAQHYLDPMIKEIIESGKWREMAYHENCACQKFDMWTYGNAKKVEALKDLYDRMVNGCRGGADGPPPIRKQVYVISPKYSLLGSYEVVKCDEGYVFVLRVPMRSYQEVGAETFVPLEEPMGVGEFADVTPEKFNW